MPETHAPVALFVYNRVEILKKTVSALRANTLVPETDLVVFSDGPKDERGREAVEAVRTLVRGIEGFRSVRVVESEKNQGLQIALTTGIGRMCEEFGKVIVLEDDVLTAPDFLSFMNWGLSEYSEDENVYAVSALWPPAPTLEDTRAFFVRYFEVAGWATWDRAWRRYDPEALGWERLRQDKHLSWRFDLEGRAPFTKGLLQECVFHDDFNWDIRWMWTIFRNGGLGLFPPRALATKAPPQNGDAEGTHGYHPWEDYFHLHAASLPRSIVWQKPLSVTEDKQKREALGRHWYQSFVQSYPVKGFAWRCFRILRQLFLALPFSWSPMALFKNKK